MDFKDMYAFNLAVQAETAIENIKAILDLIHRDEVECDRLEAIKTVNLLLRKELYKIEELLTGDKNPYVKSTSASL